MNTCHSYSDFHIGVNGQDLSCLNEYVTTVTQLKMSMLVYYHDLAIENVHVSVKCIHRLDTVSAKPLYVYMNY